MLRILVKSKYRDLMLGVALLCAGAALVLYPSQSMDAGRQGLQLCANVILPSLFPFFVLSSLVVELGIARYLGHALERLMWPLFRVGGAGASALVLGFVGGYPVGARTAIQLYEQGLLSKPEVQRLLAFCNNSGPAFILGVAGAGVFGSGTVGLLLYLVHMAASLCVGLLFRFYGSSVPARPSRRSAPQFQAVRFSVAFTNSIKSSFSSVLSICAFVVFFTVAIRLFSLCGIMDGAAHLLTVLPLRLDLTMARQLLTGLVEVSSGVTMLMGEGALSGRVSMAAFMLGWAGLSVHCQVLSFLGDSGLSASSYLLGKGLHGLLSVLFTAALTNLFPLSQPVSSYLAIQAEHLSMLEANSALAIATVSAWLLWLAFLALCVLAIRRTKKRGGKSIKYAL